MIVQYYMYMYVLICMYIIDHCICLFLIFVCRISGLTKSPFGQTSARFRTERKAMEIPGKFVHYMFFGCHNHKRITPNQDLVHTMIVKQSV